MLSMPIIATSSYLVITILLFAFGPIDFTIRQPVHFYIFISLYVVSIILGYKFGRGIANNLRTNRKATINEVVCNRKYYYIFIFGAFVACTISLQLRSLFDLIDPKFWWDAISGGLSDPEGRYVDKIQSWRNARSNKLLNFGLFAFAPFKVVFVSAFIMFWKRLRLSARVIGLLMLFVVYFMPALLTGTNKPVFDLLIFAPVTLFSLGFRSVWNNEQNARKRLKVAFGLLLVLSVFAFGFFSITMSARGGDPSYIETTSKLGDIKIRPQFKEDISKVEHFYIWFVNYLVQGYYGLSLAMQEQFTSTFGFGSSIFVSRQMLDFFGIDIAKYTYQRKISSSWDESAQWHSFYSYVANDFHFFGVIIVCFFIGVLMALVWVTFIKQSNIWSVFLLPLIALMVVFIPANNQVFGFLETFSAFLFFFIGWILSLKIVIKYR